jgi:hypothetical protein
MIKLRNAEQELTESEFFQSATVSFGVVEILEEELEEDPATVNGKELPADFIHGDGIDKVGEETTSLAEDLLDTNTTCSHSIGEQFDEVCCDTVRKLGSSRTF